MFKKRRLKNIFGSGLCVQITVLWDLLRRVSPAYQKATRGILGWTKLTISTWVPEEMHEK
jgi:hypothetical protein